MSVSNAQSSRSSVRSRLRTVLWRIPGYGPARRLLWRLIHFSKLYLAWPPLYLLWVMPRTYYRLWRDVVRAPDSADDPILAYAYPTPTYLMRYTQIARDMRTFGPNGYVYGEALGLNIGDRFFQHILSYGLAFGKLGPRRFALVSGGIFLASILVMGILTERAGWAVILAALTCGSAAFVLSLFHLNKPENLGWSFLPVTLFAMATNQPLLAMVSLFILALTSVTMVFPAMAAMGVLWLTGNLPFVSLVTISAPTILKYGWQLLRFFRRIGLRKLSEQIGGSGNNQTLKSDEYLIFLRTIIDPLKIWSVLHLTTIIALLVSGAPWGHGLVLLLPILLMIFNFRVFRWADLNTFGRLYLAFAVTYAVLYPSWLYALAFVIEFLAVRPKLVAEAGGINLSLPPNREQLSDYPHTASPIRLGRSAINQIEERLADIPAGSRLIMHPEDPFGWTLGWFRFFNVQLEWLLAPRNIEVLPGEWLRTTQLDWYVQHWAPLEHCVDPSAFTAMCHEIGAQYLVSCRPATIDSLLSAGYERVAQLPSALLKETFLGETALPPDEWNVLKVPHPIGLVEPAVTLYRQPNEMRFAGQRGVSYFIKYNYHPRWTASIADRPLVIRPTRQHGIDGMMVDLPVDGEVRFAFNTKSLM